MGKKENRERSGRDGRVGRMVGVSCGIVPMIAAPRPRAHGGRGAPRVSRTARGKGIVTCEGSAAGARGFRTLASTASRARVNGSAGLLGMTVRGLLDRVGFSEGARLLREGR